MFQSVLICKLSHEIKSHTLGPGERHVYRQMRANVLYVFITEINHIKCFHLLYILRHNSSLTYIHSVLCLTVIHWIVFIVVCMLLFWISGKPHWKHTSVLTVAQQWLHSIFFLCCPTGEWAGGSQEVSRGQLTDLNRPKRCPIL